MNACFSITINIGKAPVHCREIFLLCHLNFKTNINVGTLKSANSKSKITTEKSWDSCGAEDLEGIIYTRVQQFIAWRRESHDIDIRLEALLHPR